MVMSEETNELKVASWLNVLEKNYWNNAKSAVKKTAVIIVALVLLASFAGAVSYWWFGGNLTGKRPDIKRGAEAEHFINPPNKTEHPDHGCGCSGRRKMIQAVPTRLMVMTVDTESRAISIISVPRDTRVRVKGLGWDKVNHAYLTGGVALTRQTTENFLGIPMDYYAKVDLESFGPHCRCDRRRDDRC